MHRLMIGNLRYSYIVGSHAVGIVTPSRKKHVATIETIKRGVKPNPAEERVKPEEVLEYIAAQGLK